MRNYSFLPLLFLAACGSTSIDAPTTIEKDDIAMGPNVHARGWSKSGTLKVRDSSSRLTMQADFGDNPDVYTVQFSMPVSIGQFPVATIEWTVKGNTVARQVAVCNGTAVSGTGQYVRVTVSDQTPAGTHVAGKEYNMTMIVTPGLRPNTQQPATLPVVNPNAVAGLPFMFIVAANNSINVELPDGTGATSVFIAAIPAQKVALGNNDLQVSQLSEIGIAAREYDPLRYEWVPLSPGVTSLQLYNNLAGGGSDVYFYITLGIDG